MYSFPSVISSSPGDHPQGRRFSATGGARRKRRTLVVDLEVEVADGVRVAESLGEVLEEDASHASSCLPGSDAVLTIATMQLQER
jgi:hypothetical protein